MTVEPCQSQASFLATNEGPASKPAPIRERRERDDAAMEAFYEECRQSGRPYIDHHAASGTFRYVYFDRSRYPTSKLMRGLDALAGQFGMSHHHILTGEIYADCFGDRESLPYQGRFEGLFGGPSPEQLPSFINQLSALLPRFDRRAVIESMVAKAARDGYYVRGFECRYGDEELQDDFEKAYIKWCDERGTPYVIYSAEQDYLYFKCRRTLTPAVHARIEILANGWGMSRPADESEGGYLYPYGDDDPRRIPEPDFEGLARRLYEFLIDPRSYAGQPA